ncbi:hypothetical protein [Streptomyces antimycoticus]|nr:hypothetical protein OG751_41180 [Streptomyces antimycoticus]
MRHRIEATGEVDADAAADAVRRSGRGDPGAGRAGVGIEKSGRT